MFGTERPGPETVLLGGALIDGTGAPPRNNAGLVIEHGVLRQVAGVDELDYGKEATVIDVEGRTMMPGLIDSHTHVTYMADQFDLIKVELEESVELNAIGAAGNATSILAMGVTSIGDGGCRGFIGPAVRDAVLRGRIPGPRIVAAGPILCGSGGLTDAEPAWMHFESDSALGVIVDGPDQVRRAVRRQVKGGVDWIKVSASGVAGSKYVSAETEDLNYEEILAAVTEAAKFGKAVHAHAHSREGVRAAVEAGVLSLHSGEFADEQGLTLMRDRGVYFSPTIAWLHARCLPEYPFSEDAAFVREASRAFIAAVESVRMARKIGAPIALGTDAAHRFPHVRDAVLEIEFFQELGYSPIATIVASTKSAAEAIGRGSVVGTLEAGKFADILVVDGDPSEDVRVLKDKRNIARTFLGGTEVQGLPQAAGPESAYSVRLAVESASSLSSRPAT